MAYTPYYNNGWQNSESGGTPITAAALNHMDDGIEQNASDITTLDSKTVGVDIGVSGAKFKAGEQVTTTRFADYEYCDLYFYAHGVCLPCIRIFPHKTDSLVQGIFFSYIHPTDGGLRMFSGTFTLAGRYVSPFQLSMSNTANAVGAVAAWQDVSSNDLLYVRKIIGYA